MTVYGSEKGLESSRWTHVGVMTGRRRAKTRGSVRGCPSEASGTMACWTSLRPMTRPPTEFQEWLFSFEEMTGRLSASLSLLSGCVEARGHAVCFFDVIVVPALADWHGTPAIANL